MNKETSQVNKPQKISAIANFIFMARWLQLPLYLGLILAQIIFVIQNKTTVEQSRKIGNNLGHLEI